MSKSMKLSLENLKVQSFVTELKAREEKDKVKGGTPLTPCPHPYCTGPTKPGAVCHC